MSVPSRAASTTWREYLADVGDEAHPVLAQIVEAADERRDEIRARLRSEQRLRGGEAQGDVDGRAPGAQAAAGLETVPCQGDLDDDIGVEAGQAAALGDHAVGVDGGDLGADGAARNGGADVCERPVEGTARSGDERRVGGHPVDETGGGEIADFVYIGGVDEEFHVAPHAPFRRRRVFPAR